MFLLVHRRKLLLRKVRAARTLEKTASQQAANRSHFKTALRRGGGTCCSGGHSLVRRSTGFSLIEMALVLIVIGLILGLMQVSTNVQRKAEYDRVVSQFVLGWRESYNTFFDFNGFVIGDSAPLTGQVNGASNSPVAGSSLLNLMAQSGVAVPSGRARGLEYLDLYRGPDGVQRQLEVSFLHVTDWFVGPGNADKVPANVLRLTGVTTDLARKMDASIDGYADAAFGDFRSANTYSQSSAAAWPDLVNGSGDVQTVTVYLRMSQ